MKNIQNIANRPAPAASTAGPCPTICKSSRTPRYWKLPSTIAQPNHPGGGVLYIISSRFSRWNMIFISKITPLCQSRMSNSRGQWLFWQSYPKGITSHPTPTPIPTPTPTPLGKNTDRCISSVPIKLLAWNKIIIIIIIFQIQAFARKVSVKTPGHNYTIL